MNDAVFPGTQWLIEVAARKGVTLDIRLMSAAATAGVDLGLFVESILYVAPRRWAPLATIVCLVSGRNRVDVRYLGAVTGEVDMRRATEREVQELTGHSMGSLPPFGYGRNVSVVMDQDLTRHEWVWAAAGHETAMLRVAPQTLRALSNAVVAPCAMGSSTFSPASGQDKAPAHFA